MSRVIRLEPKATVGSRPLVSSAAAVWAAITPAATEVAPFRKSRRVALPGLASVMFCALERDLLDIGTTLCPEAASVCRLEGYAAPWEYLFIGPSRHLILSNSTSKTKVELGGITPGYPRGP